MSAENIMREKIQGIISKKKKSKRTGQRLKTEKNWANLKGGITLLIGQEKQNSNDGKKRLCKENVGNNWGNESSKTVIKDPKPMFIDKIEAIIKDPKWLKHITFNFNAASITKRLFWRLKNHKNSY